MLYQNRELVSTMYESSRAMDLNIDSGGEIYRGEKVFLQMNLRDEYVGDSLIKRSVTAVSSHTGKSSIGFGSTNKILTLDSNGNHNEYKFFRMFGAYDSFRHCQAASGRVKNAVEALFKTLVDDKQLMDSFKLMANTKCNDDLLYMIIKNCFKIDMNVNQKTLTVRQLNKMNKVASIITQQVKNEKDSVWGLFTGILKCSQELKPQTKDAQDYVMAGTGYNVNMKAYTTISQFLDNNISKKSK